MHVLKSNVINVWNIEEVSYLYTVVKCDTYEYNIKDEDSSDLLRVWYQIVNNNLVQAYDIRLLSEEIPLKYLISIDRDRALAVFEENFFTACYTWLVGDLLFSRLCNLPVVHIWDIFAGIKVKALSASVSECDLYYVILLDDE
jgi:hypothetical protein